MSRSHCPREARIWLASQLTSEGSWPWFAAFCRNMPGMPLKSTLIICQIVFEHVDIVKLIVARPQTSLGILGRSLCWHHVLQRVFQHFSLDPRHSVLHQSSVNWVFHFTLNSLKVEHQELLAAGSFSIGHFSHQDLVPHLVPEQLGRLFRKRMSGVRQPKVRQSWQLCLPRDHRQIFRKHRQVWVWNAIIIAVVDELHQELISFENLGNLSPVQFPVLWKLRQTKGSLLHRLRQRGELFELENLLFDLLELWIRMQANVEFLGIKDLSDHDDGRILCFLLLDVAFLNCFRLWLHIV